MSRLRHCKGATLSGPPILGSRRPWVVLTNCGAPWCPLELVLGKWEPCSNGIDPGQQRDLVPNNINGCDASEDGGSSHKKWSHIKRQSYFQDWENQAFWHDTCWDISGKWETRSVGAASGWQGRVCGFLVDGENVGGRRCSTPRHSDHISLSSSLGDLKDTRRFLLWANGEARVLVWMEWSAEGEIFHPVMSQM